MSSATSNSLNPIIIKNLFLFRLVRMIFIARSITKIVSVLTLMVVVVILVRLGFWQLQRADEKEQLLAQQQMQPVLTSAALVYEKNIEKLNHSQIKTKGRILTERIWLLDNQVHQGRVGYKVLAELELSQFNQFKIMVDWGWIPAEKQRSQLPQVALSNNEVEVSGLLKTKGFNQFVLAETQESGWPRRVQSLAELELPLGVIYAQTNKGGALPQTYKVVVMPPEKHKAYALQWFLLAVASVFVFWFASRRGGQQQ